MTDSDETARYEVNCFLVLGAFFLLGFLVCGLYSNAIESRTREDVRFCHLLIACNAAINSFALKNGNEFPLKPSKELDLELVLSAQKQNVSIPRTPDWLVFREVKTLEQARTAADIASPATIIYCPIKREGKVAGFLMFGKAKNGLLYPTERRPHHGGIGEALVVEHKTPRKEEAYTNGSGIQVNVRRVGNSGTE